MKDNTIEEIERREFPVKTILDNKKGNAREACESIIDYLSSPSKYQEWDIKTIRDLRPKERTKVIFDMEGWKKAGDLWKSLTPQKADIYHPNDFQDHKGEVLKEKIMRYNPATIDQQLKDLIKALIIEKNDDEIPPPTRRSNKRKKKRVYYRLSPIYSEVWNRTTEEWFSQLNESRIEFFELEEKFDIAMEILKEHGVENPRDEIEERVGWAPEGLRGFPKRMPRGKP